MLKIIDAGALRSERLSEFLAASPGNRAVLTDYASMESFKGVGSVNIRKSMKRLAEFPDQVVVLRSTRVVCGLKPRSRGLVNRLIDVSQTSDFGKYCDAIFSNSVPINLIEADIKNKENSSQSHFDLLLGNSESIRSGIHKLAGTYRSEDINDLRTQRPISSEFSKRIVSDIISVTALFFKRVGLSAKIPSASDAIYSFPFRYALCSYLLSLKWIGDGGYQSVAPDKIRNDFADMTYAAYATFFDGIITNDKKLEVIYRQACWTLENVFIKKLRH